MTTRTVFKIFGSFGPGGSVVTLMEKFCKRMFPEAYDLGDPTQFHTKEEDLIKNLRQEFVNELFNFKGPFERNSQSVKAEKRDQAYMELAQILDKYKKKMVQLEKQRLTKERIFYLREQNDVKYNQAMNKMSMVEEDINDNLTKMAQHILKPDMNKLKSLGYSAAADEEQGDIESRISRHRAAELLEAWKKMKVQAEEESERTTEGNQEALLKLDTKLKDQLFIEHGEDIDDTFAAFKHYGLNTEITQEDRNKYGRR